MFTDIAKAINESNNIIILPHKSVDGDCLGSSYALKLGLLKLGKNAQVIVEEKDKDAKFFVIIKDKESCAQNPDLVIAVDCGDIDRLESRRGIFDSCENTVNIDHHGTNDGYAKLNFVDACASATGEIIFKLLKFLQVEIDDNIAQNLYIAISSDSGRFSYSNTTCETHEIAGELIQYNFDFPYLNAFIFDTNSQKELVLIKEALKTLEVLADGKIASVTVSEKVIKKYKATDSELGGIVNYPRSIDTVQIAFYFKEQKDGVKVSMRSNGPDVSKIAKKYGGGGHERASGCTLNMPVKKAKKIMYDEAMAVIC
ncbi:MAG: bifunctional oligoribonuclease/PAP phosphatase NrnA [Clostridia bacterium]|nr:bifunctional oligoribonuclease/PAP phosphatase NrnA [Clostridia bacterium]MBQ9997446.1 bifunctional oligoribonuclease/PAP phosphatase NrnA [Clostridia bacterium]